MVSVAYLVFTFLACVLGLSLGLVVYRARQGRLAEAGFAGPDLVRGDEEQKWEAIQNWQAQENRAFATCLTSCAALPIAAAAAAWTSRGEVVGAICSGLTTVSVGSPLCF
jgi:hypothetical protein